MKNRYSECNCSCHTNTNSCDGLGNGVNLLTRIVSVKGIEMKDILFSLHFYTYMSSRKVVVRKDQLIFGGGEYYALINEKDYPEGWLMCDVEILEPANGWPHELKPVTVECSTGYFVGDCSEGFPAPEDCRFHKGEGYKNGYNVTFKPSEEIPEIYDPTELFMVDEEDLTLVNIEKNRVAKFKDRDASKGMGYIILRTGKSLAQQMKEKNTIYEIRYDFDLFGETLEIPEGCVLDFQGGEISNGTVVFNDTKLIGEVSLSLTSVQGLPSRVEASWFGIRQSNGDNSGLLNNLIKMLPSDKVYTIKFESGVYNFNSPIYIRDRINFIGESYVHGSDYWVETPKDECVLLFNHEEYGIISDNNTTGVNTFKNITFRAGNENAGGCNFISTVGSSSYNYNLIFDHCNFRGFAHKFGLRFSDSWRSSIDTCHFVGCGGGIGIIKGSSGENNDIMIFQCTIECCCVGVYGTGLMRNINIIGGTIEGIDTPDYNTTFPSEVTVPSYILDDYGVNNQDEIRSAVLIIGSMIGIIEGVYFEKIYTTDLFFSYESVVTVKGCIFNDLILKENPLISGFANAVTIEGNCFYINENRNTETYLIKQNNCRSLIFLGNDFHGKIYEKLISGTIVSSIIQNTKGIISFKSVSNLSLSDSLYLGANRIGSGDYGLHFVNGNKLVGAFTKDCGYTNRVHTTEPTKGSYVGMYFADGVNWNPLNRNGNKPYLCLWNGTQWTNVDGNRLGIDRSIEGERPVLDSAQNGYCVFDMNLNKPIWWTGSKWVDATGADV